MPNIDIVYNAYIKHIQGVLNILAHWKIEIFLLESGYILKARQSQERSSVAAMLVQYTCKRSASSGACAIRHTVRAALPRPRDHTMRLINNPINLLLFEKMNFFG